MLDCVIWYLTFFEKNSDGKYTRADERHVQYIHEEETIISELTAAGFSVTTEGHLGKEKLERINFICTRI